MSIVYHLSVIGSQRQISLLNGTLQLHLGDAKIFPSQRGYRISPASSGSARLRLFPVGHTQKIFKGNRESSRSNPNQTTKPLQRTHFYTEEQQLYCKTPLADRAPHPISKAERDHHKKEFSPFQSWSVHTSWQKVSDGTQTVNQELFLGIPVYSLHSHLFQLLG